MRVIIKIGLESFLLPSDKGVQTVMATLAKALPIDNFQRGFSEHVTISKHEYRSAISMEYIPDSVVVIDPDPKPKAEKPRSPRQLVPAQRLLLAE